MLLGVDPRASYEAKEIPLLPNDLLAITTDGLVEQLPRRGGAPLGIQRLGQFLRDATIRGGATKIVDLRTVGAETVAAARDFVGGTFRDDTCLLLGYRDAESEAQQ